MFDGNQIINKPSLSIDADRTREGLWKMKSEMNNLKGGRRESGGEREEGAREGRQDG